MLGRTFRNISLLLCLSTFACTHSPTESDPDAGPGEDAGRDPNVPPPGSFPADSSAAAIRTFLANEAYKGSGWVRETAAPRPETPNFGSPHGRVQVFFNPVLVASFQSGNGSFDAGVANMKPHERWSMVVKEFHEGPTEDGGTQLVGRASMLKTLDGGVDNAWTYYCVGPTDRCAGVTGTDANPVYGRGISLIRCAGCHAGMIFTHPPTP